eukprot:GEMP01050056.1.p2 GENE.GEMP01050056.1~~GEMP01050056.1.p2  ORF type:complete len:133 (+),score=39.92 GEMP01050056.1:49-447(+)
MSRADSESEPELPDFGGADEEVSTRDQEVHYDEEEKQADETYNATPNGVHNDEGGEHQDNKCNAPPNGGQSSPSALGKGATPEATQPMANSKGFLKKHKLPLFRSPNDEFLINFFKTQQCCDVVDSAVTRAT